MNDPQNEKKSRRDFLIASALASAAWACAGPKAARREDAGPGSEGAAPGGAKPSAPKPAAGRPLKLLILGGTGFIGPHMVRYARERGHALTLFNRGKRNPSLFADIEQLHGDRDGGLAVLQGRQWDGVIDNSGYVPRIVRASAELLAPNVRQYVFISTVSVYAGFAQENMDETAPVGTVPDEKVEQVTNETYGPLKALCEKAVEGALPGRTTVIRPGLIVGPDDPTDRFTYWPARIARGGEVLAPGAPTDPIQFIDARDLAEWTVHVIENSVTGVYNAVGPQPPVTIGDLIAECRRAAKSDAKIVWGDVKFLEEQNVAPWADMPAWVPSIGEDRGMGSVSARRAIDKGLTYRPLAVTVRETLDWWLAQPEERRAKLKAGITPEREAEVLAKWHELHPA